MPERAVYLYSRPCNSSISTVTILLSIEVNAKIVQEILGHVLPSMQRNARIECGWNCRVKHIICEAKCKFNKSSSIILRTHSLPEAKTNQYSVHHEGWGQ